MVSGAESPEKNEGSTADFAEGMAWRTDELHDKSLGAMSPGNYIPCGAERLGRPVTARIVEAANSDWVITTPEASATDPA